MVKVGNTTMSKDQAIADFKTKKAAEYTSKFPTEPKVRPSYIPNTYSVGGTNVNVVYNSGFGGYGYYHPISHAWIAYDMMSDAVMLSAMMNRHGYVGYAQPVPVYSSGWSIFSFILSLVFIGMTVLMIGCILFAPNRRW